MLRSEKKFPLTDLELTESLQHAWEKGWLNDFAEDHFLIKAIEKRLDVYPKLYRIPDNIATLFPITRESFQNTFCINFSIRIGFLISLFGEDNIRRFVTDQLSAGKENYNKDQFFRALSEVSVLCFLGMNAVSGVYEPRTNGKKNPEARLLCKNGVTIDIEVKTPGFTDFDGIENIVIPTVLLDDLGREAFMVFCKSHGLNGAMPRAMKLKEYLNNAAMKFGEVDHVSHMNFLYINWSFSEFMDSGFEEAFSLMANNINGILTHREIGKQLGIDDEVYDKITAVIVYTESLQGMMFGDLRYIWTRGYNAQPHFGIIGMHNCDGLFEITQINPYAEQLTPIFTGILHDTSCVEDLMSLISQHMLKTQEDQS